MFCRCCNKPTSNVVKAHHIHPRPQKLPPSGPAREALREKGQFWTPAWLAQAMAAWVTDEKPTELFDPAVGPGTFFAAARSAGFAGKLRGFELDRDAFADGAKLGLHPADFSGVSVADFLQAPSREHFPAIISNPPYIRHHRLGEERKAELKEYARKTLGFPLDGRTGLQAYFLFKCLSLLAPDGRLAFLLPADVCEGMSSRHLWEWIGTHYRIEAVLTFAEAAAPFPQVDTNAMVFLISRNPPAPSLLWCRVERPDRDAILDAVRSGVRYGKKDGAVNVLRRETAEAIATGLSRPPAPPSQDGLPLSRFARVMRGIATGDNDFFFLTSEQIRAAHFPERYFRRAIGRTRDCPGSVISHEDLEALDATGRPTWLLNLGSEPVESLPAPLRAHLENGESEGTPQRALIATRRPWYRMEQRTPPPLLFAYLGRRDCRFILNRADVVPLTGFLCVYPHDAAKAASERLWRALNHPLTLANLSYVAKSYGSGALKVEPRQLEHLKIPFSIVDEFRLLPLKTADQLVLLETPAKPKRRNHTA